MAQILEGFGVDDCLQDLVSLLLIEVIVPLLRPGLLAPRTANLGGQGGSACMRSLEDSSSHVSASPSAPSDSLIMAFMSWGRTGRVRG